MNTTEAAQSAPPDGLVGGRGKDTVSVGLEFASAKSGIEAVGRKSLH